MITLAQPYGETCTTAGRNVASVSHPSHWAPFTVLTSERLAAGHRLGPSPPDLQVCSNRELGRLTSPFHIDNHLHSTCVANARDRIATVPTGRFHHNSTGNTQCINTHSEYISATIPEMSTSNSTDKVSSSSDQISRLLILSSLQLSTKLSYPSPYIILTDQQNG